MHEEWFADEENVRRAVGILEKPAVNSTNFKEVSYEFSMTNFLYFHLRVCFPHFHALTLLYILVGVLRDLFRELLY